MLARIAKHAGLIPEDLSFRAAQPYRQWDASAHTFSLPSIGAAHRLPSTLGRVQRFGTRTSREAARTQYRVESNQMEGIMSEPSLIDVAKAPIIAYGEKNWEAVRAAVSPGFLYDEVATHRKVQGVGEVVACWQGWATALPDSKATFHNAFASGNSVVLEITWSGKHTGPLQMPTGQIAATGKAIQIRACLVVEIASGKVQSMRHYYDLATMMRQLGVTG